MKHNTKITVILISMFLITQLIGLFVINFYMHNDLPYGMQPPPEMQENNSLLPGLFDLFVSFLIAIILFLLLIRVNANFLIKIWFFVVTVIAIGISLNVLFFDFRFLYASIISLIFAIILGFLKIFKRNIIIHNITELLIYPGIASVFIILLSNLFGSYIVLGIIIILLLISIYDIWAVWHSGVMQKMAKYQIDTLKIFTGFFIPYASNKEKTKIKTIRDKYKKYSEKRLNKELTKAKIKINLAILGGGDVIFPIIAAGIFYKIYSSLASALIISLCATIALLWLFIFAKKKKFYPAMPFLTIGIYIGMMIAWVLMNFHLI
jgi:presenilin-like A22 family membrane protease